MRACLLCITPGGGTLCYGFRSPAPQRDGATIRDFEALTDRESAEHLDVEWLARLGRREERSLQRDAGGRGLTLFGVLAPHLRDAARAELARREALDT